MARQVKSTNVNSGSSWAVLKAAATFTDEADVYRTVDGDAETALLQPHQWQAIQLLVSGARGVDVAQELGVTPETVSRWRALPVFQAALNMAIRDSYQATIGSLRDAKTEALGVLRELLQAEDERLRLSAALSVLRLHLQLDAGALQLSTTPADVAEDVLDRLADRERRQTFRF